MPFICLQHSPPSVTQATDPHHISASAAYDSGWRRLSVAWPFALWVREPCAVWQGMVDRRSCWLLCDGFIARPCRVDAKATNHDLVWLAKALLRDGISALIGIEGQYAMCFVNVEAEEMIAARDRLGGQPLYWSRIGGVSAAASKSRDIARLPWCGAEENPSFMSDCFAIKGQHVPGSTPFARVNEVEPGGRVRFATDDVHVDRCSLPFAPPDCRTPADWVEAFRSIFEYAVQEAVGVDGDVAVMLSGGLDSGPVLSAASAALRGQDRRLSAVSWVLPGFPDSDESRWIIMAAKAAGVELDTFGGDSFLPFSNLDEGDLSPELPYYNATRRLLLACYRRAAGRRCAVVLAATHGDMIYARRFAVLYDLVRRRNWSSLWAELGCMYHRLGIIRMYRDPALRYPAARIRRRLCGDRKRPHPEWLTEYAVEQAPEQVSWPPEAEHYPVPEHAYRLLGPAMTFGTAQENDFAQRCGIERRDPFLNEALVGLMLHAPVVLSHLKGQSKWIMREAMRGRIPEPIRLKRRTGVLTDFVKSGYDRNRRSIRRLLLDRDERHWQRYVKPAYVGELLAVSDPPDDGIMAICACIGYTLWRGYWDDTE